MRLAVAVALVLWAAPAPALAQRDVGPVRVAFFGGVRASRRMDPLIGLAGELALGRVWTLAAAASLVSLSSGSYAQYEIDARWRSGEEGGVRPYLGAGASVTRSSVIVVGGPSRTRLGGLAIAGVEAPVLGTTAFVEALGVEDGDLVVQVRGGLRLLLLGR